MTRDPDSPAAGTSFRHQTSATWGQLLRFGVVGVGVNASLFYVYLALVNLAFAPKLAMTLMYLAGLTAGFVLNRRWAFASTGQARRQALLYWAIGAAGYSLNLAVLALCVDGLGWHHGWVQAVMMVAVAGLNFALNKYWVFAPADR